MTTTLTCFESIREALKDIESNVASEFAGFTREDAERFQDYAKIALDHTDDWRSEGAARKYCIVRAVPPIARLLKDVPLKDDTFDSDDELRNVLRKVWRTIGPAPETSGMFELAQAQHGQAQDAAEIDDESGIPYPPNAFLTYWAIRGLKEVGGLEEEYDEALGTVETWLYGVIGREVAKYYDGSHDKDPQQLAWAMCGYLLRKNVPLAERAEGAVDLIATGLRCFFDQQLPSGIWDTGRALFHYPEAGNAYCYVFETLCELVELSLDQNLRFSVEVRRALSPYLPCLLRAYDYLERTQRELGTKGDGRIGWSSGHHSHRPGPESWATATAFRFLQALRRLVGLKARDLALLELRAQRPGSQFLRIKDRGDSWDTGLGPVGTVLEEYFVNPSRCSQSESDQRDPDRPRLARDWARSAILYGPPGTGKTTLAKLVAGELGWHFIEITPANFLDRGTDFVSARADQIFQTLSEIDGAVVLFDEIDELIRVRKDSDMLGRFFTTTMLPRLARLWEAKRLIFFVNTNSIGQVDPAVRRSQRFDAALFVLPPSLQKKCVNLDPSMATLLDEKEIETILSEYGIDGKGAALSPATARDGWLPFIRFEQIPRLGAGEVTDVEELRAMVERLGMQVFPDWALAGEDSDGLLASHDSDVCLRWILDAYRSELVHQRLDPSRLRVESC